MHISTAHCHLFFAALFDSVEKELSRLSFIGKQPLCSEWRTHLLQPDVHSNLYDHVDNQFNVCCLPLLLALAERGT